MEVLSTPPLFPMYSMIRFHTQAYELGFYPPLLRVHTKYRAFCALQLGSGITHECSGYNRAWQFKTLFSEWKLNGRTYFDDYIVRSTWNPFRVGPEACQAYYVSPA